MTTPTTQFAVTVEGFAEPVTLRAPTDGQVTALWRQVRLNMSDSVSVEARFDAAVTAEDIVISLVVDDATRATIQRRLIQGEMSLGPFVKSVFETLNAEQVFAAPAAAPRAVRRGRPRKNAAN